MAHQETIRLFPSLYIFLTSALPALLLATACGAEAGTPFIGSYSHREYEAHPQNWAIAQDGRGVMYFGNTAGVLEFDGVTWRLVKVANDSIVRSLAVDSSGTLFVGAVGELGLLRPGERGEPVYESLMDEIPVKDRGFADVWRTFATDDGVFFWSGGKFFHRRDGSFRVREFESHLVPGVVDGKLYVNREESGLMVFEKDRFEPVEGGAATAGIRVFLVLPAGDGGLLLGTREGELYRLASKAPGLVRFETEADSFLAGHRLYSGTRLPNGTYLLGTMGGGAAVVDSAGALLHRFDRDNGLPDNSVWTAEVDRQGGLWLGLNRGIAHLEIGSPLTVFDPTSGIEGTVEALARHEGTLWAATGSGLFRLVKGRFEPLPAIPGPCWSLLSFEPSTGDSRLLVGANSGVYEVRGETVRPIRPADNAFEIYRSARDPSAVFVGTGNGLEVLRYGEAGSLGASTVDEIVGEIRSLAEDDSGRLWLSVQYQGVIRLTLDLEGEALVADRADFGTAEGLPALNGNRLYPLEGEMLLATLEGLYRFDPESERFEPSTLLGEGFTRGHTGISRLAVGEGGRLWLSQLDWRGPALAHRGPDGSVVVDDLPFRRLPKGYWYAILPERGGVTWLGGTEGLYRFDSKIEVDVERDFSTLIRSVSTGAGVLLYEGTPASPTAGRTEAAGATLAFEDNSLAFRFSAATFSHESETQYRYLLEGYDEEWSPWRKDTKKEYTNLPEGQYRFRVQAKNIYDTLGKEAVYDFAVLAPWYRTTVFRAAMVFLAVALCWVFYRMLVARIRKTQKEIAERDRRAEREKLIARLEETNAELEHFTFTVSHDLKAPLLTIRGFLGLLRRDLASGKTESLLRDVRHIDAAALKMGTLLNELLELSRVGRHVNPPEQVPFGDLVAEARQLVAGEIGESGVEISVAADLPVLVGDRARLLEVVQNLLQNAVKYMGDQPSPRVEIGVRRNGGEEVLYFRDNGLGIDPRYHEKVFGIFERLDAATEGTGVGLALVRRIVEFHGGRVWVESEGHGRGSTFCLDLPGGGEQVRPSGR